MINQEIPIFDISGIQTSTTTLPKTLTTPLNKPLITEIFRRMNMTNRAPYAVSPEAGKQHSAEGWGTGRAMARVARVKGSGTKRAGEGAFANFCRKGRLAHPTKTTRRWQRKTNLNERLHAISSGLSSTTNPNLLESRGHLIEDIKTLPIVVKDNILELRKTKDAMDLLKKLGLGSEIERVKQSRNIRAGMGKMRNRRYRMRRGILIIHNYDNSKEKIDGLDRNGALKAFRNISGVEFMKIGDYDLCKICPGGSLGRLCLWTENAINGLDESIKELKMGKEYAEMESLISNPKSNIMDIFYTQEVQALVEENVYEEYTRNQDPAFILENNSNLLEIYQ